MNPTATIRAYYEALRSGDPLAPYFLADSSAVKFGITERLIGFEEIAEGLRTQTETTTDWQVESSRLTVGERPDYAWFGDEVSMAWTDVTADERHAYETRWSGTLERVGDSRSDDSSLDAGNEEDEGPSGEQWRFVSMHVSRPGSH